tara:strand:- start:672 stop:896 length:225 start_codon:yes stop_codon:yes gene_type:complete
MTFEEKKKLYDEMTSGVTDKRRKQILKQLNYPSVIGTGAGNVHADVTLKAWRDYWEGNPPHPNWGWGEIPEHLK